MEKSDVIIIGGGPAGLFSALQCAEFGLRVLLLEKNSDCGKKLLISGAGQCNLTQAGSVEDFFDCYGQNGRFVRHGLSKFSNRDFTRWLNREGLSTVAVDSGKVFPLSMNAVDVLSLFKRLCRDRGVEIKVNVDVQEVKKVGEAFEVVADNECYMSKYVVIATGGISYPQTGSTGDGYVFAKSLGHKIVPVKPALASVKVKEYAFADLSGQSFDLSYTLWRDGKKVGDYSGSVLLTHRGLSGPGIINHARDMQKKDVLKLNFIGESVDEARSHLMTVLGVTPKKLVRTVVIEEGLPKRFVEELMEQAGIGADMVSGQLPKEQRKSLLRLLVEYEMEIREVGGYGLAMATAGGVSLKEVNRSTMESRICPGLYFAGEVLDVDGDTGGYNIQWAVSSGYVAAMAIVESGWEW